MLVLINREWVHYREISDRGFNVLTSLSLGQYIKVSVWDFPAMTERTSLISYLLYGLFSAILKKNAIKTPKVIFYIRLRALWLASSLLILNKYLCTSFSFSYWKYSCTLSIFLVVFAHAIVDFTHAQLKKADESRKSFIMPGHYKKIMPAQQPIRAHVLLSPYNKK